MAAGDDSRGCRAEPWQARDPEWRSIGRWLAARQRGHMGGAPDTLKHKTRIGAVLLLLATALLARPATSLGGAADWTYPIPITEGLVQGRSPTVAYADDGSAYAVWDS